MPRRVALQQAKLIGFCRAFNENGTSDLALEQDLHQSSTS